MTAPLTPADCDLRGMAFMPLDVVRLVDSDLVALSTGDEFKAAVMLWCKAWLQVPAASLPDDDRVLAHLSGAGARWRKVRDAALRGFIKCEDGRLYHPVIAAKATEAMAKRQSYKERSAKGNGKRWGSQKDKQTDPSGIAEGVLELPKGEGEGQRDNSVAKATGAEAPQADPDKAFWDTAKAYLGKNRAGQIGKWLRDHGRERTAEALARAQVERAVDPVAFVEGCFRAERRAPAMAYESPC